MWRYSKVYPLDRKSVEISFNETITPLASAKIANVNILAKMDSLMPTGSFKDRGAAMVVNYLNTQGIRSISEDSVAMVAQLMLPMQRKVTLTATYLSLPERLLGRQFKHGFMVLVALRLKALEKMWRKWR